MRKGFQICDVPALTGCFLPVPDEIEVRGVKCDSVQSITHNISLLGKERRWEGRCTCLLSNGNLLVHDTL